MDNFLADIPLIVEIAKQGSFSKAAEILDIGVSTASRRIKLLEKALGTMLFHRNTHSVTLTFDGELLLEHCEFIKASADSALAALTQNMLHPSGCIRISMFADMYHELMCNMLSEFCTQWPNIHLHIRFAEEPPNLQTEPYDIAFCTGPLPDSSMIAKKVTRITPGVYAAPKLIARFFEPNEPQDLLALPCIALSRFGSIWELHQGEQTSVVRTVPHFAFDSILLVREFALAGHGVALLRHELALPYLKDKRLVRLLPQWSVPAHDLFIVTARKNMPKRVQLFVQYILQSFAKHNKTGTS